MVSRGLRANDLDKHLVDGTIRQIRPFKGNPWGIFILEFRNPRRVRHGPGHDRHAAERAAGAGSVQEEAVEPCLLPQREPAVHLQPRLQALPLRPLQGPDKDGQTAPLAAFGWGPGDPIRTLCEYNLNALEWPDGQPDAEGWVAAWSQAFDVEKVTRRFYEDYAAVFERSRSSSASRTNLKGDDLRMFTQTLFNRLMFLRFMERKGWLTFRAAARLSACPATPPGRGKKSFYKGRLSGPSSTG